MSKKHPKLVPAVTIARWLREICPKKGCSVSVDVTESVSLSTGQKRPGVTRTYSVLVFAGDTPAEAKLWLKWEGNSIRRFRRTLEANAREVT